MVRLPHTLPADLQRARALVLEHGWNPTAYQILNPGMQLWFAAAGDAAAGYVERHGVWVAAGAPVCAPERLAEVAAEFEAAAAGGGVCYFCAGERLGALFRPDASHARMLIGAQPAWHPRSWAGMLAGHASLRAQLTRARNTGVEVREWPVERATDAPRLRHCLQGWLAGKGLPTLHFLVEPDTLGRLYDRRVLVAERGGRVVGFLVASPIPRRDGWLVEQVVRGPGAPNGTSELMIDAAVRAALADGSRYITLGLSPLSRRAGAPGLAPEHRGHLPIRLLLGWLRAHAQRFYNFQGLESFKAKFRPAEWEPVWAIASRPRFSARMLYATAAAFSDRSVPSTLSRALAGAVRQEVRWVGERLRG